MDGQVTLNATLPNPRGRVAILRDIMSRYVLVRVEQHPPLLRGAVIALFVFADGLLDLFPVGSDVIPGGFQLGGSAKGRSTELWHRAYPDGDSCPEPRPECAYHECRRHRPDRFHSDFCNDCSTFW